MASPPANIIFDFDGTLADTLPAYLAILYRNQDFDPKTLASDQLKRLQQMSLHKVFSYLRASPLSRLRVLLFHYLRMHNTIGQAGLFPGVREAIAELKAQEHRLFIVTSNTERNVLGFLKSKHLEHYFEAIHHVFVARKAAGLADFVRQRGLDISETMYICNEEADMRAVSNIGLQAIGVLWSGQDPSMFKTHGAVAVVKTPAELLSLKLLQ
ncbi:MAG: HAD family hydrolase [Candidatus Saccharimonadales bacterium]